MSVKTARQFHTSQTHFLRKSITYSDDGTALTVGYIPAGSVINKASSGVHITTAFNAAGSNVLDVGTDADPDFWGTDLALGTLGFVPFDHRILSGHGWIMRAGLRPRLSLWRI